MPYPQPPSSVIQANIDSLQQREELGRKKYGQDLDRKDLSHTDLLEHARQEALDQANYLQASIQRLSNAEAKYLDLRHRLETLVGKNTGTAISPALIGQDSYQFRRILDEHDARMIITGNFSR